MRPALLAALLLVAQPVATGHAAGTSFVDRFDRLDPGRWYVSDGWTNGAHQNCLWSKDQVALEDGAATLTFEARRAKGQDYACAEIQTRRRYGYGTYEARLRTPAGSGLNAAFFTYIGPQNKAAHDEIDFEFLLKDTSRVQLNAHVKGKGGNEHLAALPAPSDGGYHDYAFRWEPGRLSFYVDGQLVHTIDDPAKVPDQPSKIFFSLWSTDTLTQWMGPFEPPTEPVSMRIDRIAYTAPGDPCPFRGSVACGGE